MRIVVKGGVWKNTEDEILKAAISKYGKNQWARISSLLVRKTPKQCKARWMEWLDPAIKKTEWSKEEDEKLLHLAKLMPTQWRTIAPIVGRTANQSLERYQKLLDEAEQHEANELGLTGVDADDAGPSADDVRRLRPGEVDPDPENRPARPDPIDMDEDEKEMLSEARARLANTQGKKAKRKARERQLEEARRLAMLQKRRELKAAGILMRAKPKKGGMDYMADIPFEKQPAAGFYDTTEEDARKAHAPIGKTLRQLDGHRDEPSKRKQGGGDDGGGQNKRQKKDKDASLMANFVPPKGMQIEKEEQQIAKRRRLNLPGPQVTEAELEEIVKIGQSGEDARGMVGDSGNEASQGLLGDYSALTHARNARTPRTAPQHDNVMAEARNIRNMSMQQTPLLGEENTPLHELVGRGKGYEGVTPARHVAATPNPLATPRTDVSATPLRTPMRNSLQINADDGQSTVADTPRSVRDVKAQLRTGFRGLPEPKNAFELVLPDEADAAALLSDDVRDALRIEDAAEREKRLKAIRDAEANKALARRSQVVRRGLPRPVDFDAAAYLRALDDAHDDDDDDNARADAERLVAIEMVKLIEHDAVVYPVPGGRRAGGGGVSHLDAIDDDDLAAARRAVHTEIATALGLPGASAAAVQRALAGDSQAFDGSWRAAHDALAYDASTNAFVAQAAMSDADRIAGLAALLDLNREKMTRESTKAAKAEKKLAVTLGGYQARAKALGTRLTDAYDDVAAARIEYASFDRLATNEEGAAVRRIEALRDEVDNLERREREGQSRFRELMDVKDMLARSIADFEMDEAERLNEMAMAE